MSKAIIIVLLAVVAVIAAVTAIGVIYIVIDTIKFNSFLKKSLKEVHKEAQNENR